MFDVHITYETICRLSHQEWLTVLNCLLSLYVTVANGCLFSVEFQNLDLIVRLQNRAKRYRSVVQTQQIPKNRAENVVDTQFDRNKEINMNLLSILDDLIDEFPEHKFSIQRVRQTLKDWAWFTFYPPMNLMQLFSLGGQKKLEYILTAESYLFYLDESDKQIFNYCNPLWKRINSLAIETTSSVFFPLN